ncbi:MAG: hypothetical protein H6815_03765 [Phycisphaeraceae bacterium]|nr:hypothetical protein [Phycisphaerales bacterium]MCB9859546.1 hypothetical protein [Phycisphaeraceae bacterium]
MICAQTAECCVKLARIQPFIIKPCATRHDTSIAKQNPSFREWSARSASDLERVLLLFYWFIPRGQMMDEFGNTDRQGNANGQNDAGAHATTAPAHAPKSLPRWSIMITVVAMLVWMVSKITRLDTLSDSSSLIDTTWSSYAAYVAAIALITLVLLVLAKVLAKRFDKAAGVLLSLLMCYGACLPTIQSYTADQTARKINALHTQLQSENDQANVALLDALESDEILTAFTSLDHKVDYFRKLATLVPKSEKPFALAAADMTLSLDILVDAKMHAALAHQDLGNVSIAQFFDIDHLNKLVAAEQRVADTSQVLVDFISAAPNTLRDDAISRGMDKHDAQEFTARLMKNMRPQTIVRIHEIDVEVYSMLVKQHRYLLDHVGSWSIKRNKYLVFDDPQDEANYWAIYKPTEALEAEQKGLMRLLLSSGEN